MITTEAWVLYRGTKRQGARTPGRLRKERYAFPDLTEREVLVEPIYGCWEGNMTHAVTRDPIDVCRLRQEPKVVLGNAGVVRILKTGNAVASLQEGALCLVFCNGVWDARGYPEKIYGYDAPGTVGLLARRTKLHERQLIPIPENTQHTLPQWAAFSLRYVTAWANWKVAYGAWRSQAADDALPAPHVWGWGGGVTLAEVTLAAQAGCRVAMLASDDERLRLMRGLGVDPVDRRPFRCLQYDPARYATDPAYRKDYKAAEATFLDVVTEKTGGVGVSIFVDFIGLPVFRATLKALARPGVVTTAGWKRGMELSTVRALECMNWHTHVHTHYARYQEGLDAVRFGEAQGWMPPVDGALYDWERVPELAQAHAEGDISSYFPLFQVNPL